MNEGRDLVRLLRAADQSLSSASLSREARQRIGADLVAAARAPHDRGRVLLPTVVGVLGAAAAVWFVARPSDAPAPRPETTRAVRAAGFTWEGDRCAASEREGSLTLDGGCRVRADEVGMSILSRGQAELVHVDDGVRLALGSAEFEVAHRAPRRPVRVWVSAGAIEITGTRFIVEQNRRGGHVDLLEGSIRFRATDGSVTQVRPGTRFDWVDPPARPATGVPAAVDASPPARAGVDAPAAADGEVPIPARRAMTGTRAPADQLSSESVSDVMERVQVLRVERRYREAVELLEQARAGHQEPHTAEVLSFEEGDLLERLGDDRRACDHWRAHQSRFAAGIYRDAVTAALSRPPCR